MRQAHLIAASVTATALIMAGWGGPLMTDLFLLIGGIFAGHVLTEVLNDPME